MTQFQLLTGYVNLAAERDNVVFRGTDDPMTYPEALVLQAIHGGHEHVHTLVEIGYVERDDATEMSRLEQRYGDIAKQVFPLTAGRVMLPAADTSIPTAEEVAEAEKAAAEVLANRKNARSKDKPKDKPAAAPAPEVPDLTS